MIRHLFGGSTEVTACSGKLAGHKRTGTAVSQVIAEQATLQKLVARIRVWTRHRQLVQKPEKYVLTMKRS